MKGLVTSRYLLGVERSPFQREDATKLKVEVTFNILVMRQGPRCYSDDHHLLFTPVRTSHSLSRFILVCIIFQCNTCRFQ